MKHFDRQFRKLIDRHKQRLGDLLEKIDASRELLERNGFTPGGDFNLSELYKTADRLAWAIRGFEDKRGFPQRKHRLSPK
jgi:hypothetical protein